MESTTNDNDLAVAICRLRFIGQRWGVMLYMEEDRFMADIFNLADWTLIIRLHCASAEARDRHVAEYLDRLKRGIPVNQLSLGI